MIFFDICFYSLFNYYATIQIHQYIFEPLNVSPPVLIGDYNKYELCRVTEWTSQHTSIIISIVMNRFGLIIYSFPIMTMCTWTCSYWKLQNNAFWRMDAGGMWFDTRCLLLTIRYCTWISWAPNVIEKAITSTFALWKIDLPRRG